MGIEIGFDEFDTEFDEPYVVRCVKTIDSLQVEAGTEWEIFSPGYVNDFLLEAVDDSIGWDLDLTRDDLDEHFEIVREGKYYD